jgi:hypothetical protein
VAFITPRDFPLHTPEFSMRSATRGARCDIIAVLFDIVNAVTSEPRNVRAALQRRRDADIIN